MEMSIADCKPIEMNLENFKKAVATAKHDDIDGLCIAWLKCLCCEYGRKGKHADTLLSVVASMLDIGVK